MRNAHPRLRLVERGRANTKERLIWHMPHALATIFTGAVSEKSYGNRSGNLNIVDGKLQEQHNARRSRVSRMIFGVTDLDVGMRRRRMRFTTAIPKSAHNPLTNAGATVQASPCVGAITMPRASIVQSVCRSLDTFSGYQDSEQSRAGALYSPPTDACQRIAGFDRLRNQVGLRAGHRGANCEPGDSFRGEE